MKIYVKRNFILIALVFFSLNNLLGVNTDSLIVLLNNAKGENNVEEQVNILLKIGYEFNAQQKFNAALQYYNEGLGLSTGKDVKAKYLNRIGQVFVDSANYSEALVYLFKSAELYKTIIPCSDFATTYNLIGMCYGLTNNLDSALIAFKNALYINIDIPDSSGVGYNYYNIGLVHHFKGQYDRAITNYLKSLEIREAIKDTSAIIASLTSVGEIFRLRDEPDKSMKYYQKALSYKSSLQRQNLPGKQLNKNKEILAYIYSEIGLIYKKQLDYEKALSYFDTALVYSMEINYKRGIATLSSYKANIEKSLKNYRKAKELYQESLNAYRIINYGPGISQALTSLAEIEIEYTNYANAIKMLDSAWNGAKNNNLLEEQTEILRLKLKANRALGKTEKALFYYDEYSKMKDSLFNIGREKQIEEIEAKFQTEKKEKQIEILNQETAFQKQKLRSQYLLLVALVLIVLFFIAIGLLFIRQNKLKSKLVVEQNRQKLLRSQMNPHFIYNSLSAIQNFILSNNSLESVTYISEFSGLMRMVLENSRKDLITLKEDIDFVNYYLKLQRLRFSDKFNFNISIDEKINTEIVKIPPMLTQPFIENAVDHGMRQIEKDGVIQVDYRLDEKGLVITITDNGKGMSEEANCKHNSLAITITKERIVNISKLQNLKIRMEITEAFPDYENKGVRVIFRIPQIK